MTPGWYSTGDHALHWFTCMGPGVAESLCDGKVERIGALRQSNGSYCHRCELNRQGLWDGRANESRAA